MKQKFQKALKDLAPRRRFELQTATEGDGESSKNDDPPQRSADEECQLKSSPSAECSQDIKSASSPTMQMDKKIDSVANSIYRKSVDEIAGASLSIRDVTCSVIDLVPRQKGFLPLAGVFIDITKESLLLCGKVSGAIHVRNMHSSVLFASSGQFRIHDSTNCTLYIDCSSRPAIEDCSSIRFAPLSSAHVSVIL